MLRNPARRRRSSGGGDMRAGKNRIRLQRYHFLSRAGGSMKTPGQCQGDRGGARVLRIVADTGDLRMIGHLHEHGIDARLDRYDLQHSLPLRYRGARCGWHHWSWSRRYRSDCADRQDQAGYRPHQYLTPICALKPARAHRQQVPGRSGALCRWPGSDCRCEGLAKPWRGRLAAGSDPVACRGCGVAGEWFGFVRGSADHAAWPE